MQVGDLRRIVDRLDHSVIGRRDEALLLVGFASAMRASELVAVEVRDLEDREEGVVVTKRRSKTDQEAVGVRIALPFGRGPSGGTPAHARLALRAWQEVGAVEDGPLFRSVSRHGGVGDQALSERAVSLVVKRTVAAIGLNPVSYSAHWLRAGFATTAAANAVASGPSPPRRGTGLWRCSGGTSATAQSSPTTRQPAWASERQPSDCGPGRTAAE